MRTFPQFFLQALPILLTFAVTGHASTVVIDNLPLGAQGFAQSLTGPSAVGFLGGPIGNRQVTFSFQTGPVASVLTDLTMSINIGGINLSPVDAVVSTGSPVANDQTGAVAFGSVTPTTTAPTTQTHTISNPVGIALVENTTYWVLLKVTTGAANYTFNNTTSQVLEPGWGLGNSWSFTPNLSGGVWAELSSGPQARIRMTVTESIPEPTPAGLVTTLAAVGLMRRRRK